MSVLEKIKDPDDLKGLDIDQLKMLCDDIREYIIETIPAIGGHFASSLGVVELTVALHHIYDAPKDKILWDVGHQGYVHKILTGRKAALKNIRQYQGISGFLKREESVYDVFGAGHASTSISAGLGIAKARDLQGKDYKVISVIGDGGITGGLAYEGLNNAGELKTNFTVILNDNRMSISENVGAISKYLVNIVTNPFYQKLRSKIWDLTGKMPKSDAIRTMAHKLEESLKTLVIPGMFFEDLGFTYYGPVDGHDLEETVKILSKVKDLPGPNLVHFTSVKGKGFKNAEDDPIKYHGLKALKKEPVVEKPVEITYTEIFGRTIEDLTEKFDDICVITPAMREGSGLVNYKKKFPERFFDVGIAEGHAVTFSAGLATEGMKPVVAIYSTFLQRAFDHLIHDVCVQNLPVMFAIDRAGIVGPDGETHQGNFDLSYLNSVPGITVCAPKDGTELRHMLYTGIFHKGPFAVRYPRDIAPSVDWDSPYEKITIGSWEQLTTGGNILVLAVGSMVEVSLKSAKTLREKNINIDVVNSRFVKPLDKKFLLENSKKYDLIVTIEENTLESGFGNKVDRFFIDNNLKVNHILNIGIPDKFITHGSRGKLLEIIGLSADGIANKIEEASRSKISNLVKNLF